MKDRMEIPKYLDRQKREATKALEEGEYHYHENLEHQHLQIVKVVYEGKETKYSKSNEERDTSTKFIIQTFDVNFEEELA